MQKVRKMSKSLGNGVDPMDVIEKYGADSLQLLFIDRFIHQDRTCVSTGKKLSRLGTLPIKFGMLQDSLL